MFISKVKPAHLVTETCEEGKGLTAGELTELGEWLDTLPTPPTELYGQDLFPELSSQFSTNYSTDQYLTLSPYYAAVPIPFPPTESLGEKVALPPVTVTDDVMRQVASRMYQEYLKDLKCQEGAFEIMDASLLSDQVGEEGVQEGVTPPTTTTTTPVMTPVPTPIPTPVQSPLTSPTLPRNLPPNPPSPSPFPEKKAFKKAPYKNAPIPDEENLPHKRKLNVIENSPYEVEDDGTERRIKRTDTRGIQPNARAITATFVKDTDHCLLEQRFESWTKTNRPSYHTILATMRENGLFVPELEQLNDMLGTEDEFFRDVAWVVKL
jgi:hypothetical protein